MFFRVLCSYFVPEVRHRAQAAQATHYALFHIAQIPETSGTAPPPPLRPYDPELGDDRIARRFGYDRVWPASIGIDKIANSDIAPRYSRR